MTLPRHELIKARREELGISQSEIARRIGLSNSMYWDVELYSDELINVLPLASVRALSEVLGFDLKDLLGLPSGTNVAAMDDRPRHNMIVEARQSLGTSVPEMADAIGFYDEFVYKIESDPNALETYPFDVLLSVASYLKIDPIRLLYARCDS